jgi:hypothetical protein
MTAFVTQENPRLDYTGLMDVTDDVVFVTAYDFNSMTGSESNIRLVDGIRRKLASFDPATDYVVPSGSPLVTAVVFAILHEKTNKFNVLRWSNAEGRYHKFTIEV